MKLAALVIICFGGGAILKFLIRNFRAVFLLSFLYALASYCIFDWNRLKQYLVPRSIIDMWLEPVLYEGPPFVFFALIPTLIGALLAGKRETTHKGKRVRNGK